MQLNYKHNFVPYFELFFTCNNGNGSEGSKVIDTFRFFLDNCFRIRDKLLMPIIDQFTHWLSFIFSIYICA
jgi:hypothetical protein